MTLMDSLELQQWEVKELLPNLRLLNANFDRLFVSHIIIKIKVLVKELLAILRLLTAILHIILVIVKVLLY